MMFSCRCETCSLIAKVGFLPPYRKSRILAESSSNSTILLCKNIHIALILNVLLVVDVAPRRDFWPRLYCMTNDLRPRHVGFSMNNAKIQREPRRRQRRKCSSGQMKRLLVTTLVPHFKINFSALFENTTNQRPKQLPIAIMSAKNQLAIN